VLVIEAKGRLITRELVEVEILKIVPDVPVETLAITLPLTAMVEVPEMEIPVPAVSREEMSEKTGAPVPADLNTWKTVPTAVFLKVEPS